MATGVVRGRQTFTNDGGGYSNQQNAQNALRPSQAYYDKTAKMIANYRANLNNNNNTKTVYVNDGGGGYSAPSYSGPSSDDIVSKIKSLLEEQKAQADNYYKTLYEQQTAQNKQAWENNRNQINRNFARGSRYLQNMYGDSVSGQGLSNRARNYQNWQSNLAENQRNYTNNDATALSQYNMNKANTASQLAQGWYNYVLPVYTNRQQTLDDYDYRKYLASL